MTGKHHTPETKAKLSAINKARKNNPALGHTVSDEARAKLRALRTTHGMTGKPTHVSWIEMRRRCRPGDRNAQWAGRGITVCARWQFFDNFLADMGERPPGTTLDRINNDGNYEPGNCRWGTPSQQARNQRKPEPKPCCGSLNRARHRKGCAKVYGPVGVALSASALNAIGMAP